MKRTRHLALVLALVLSGTALAQEPTQPTEPGPSPQAQMGAPTDSRLAEDQAASGAQTEVKLGPKPVHEMTLLQDFLKQHRYVPEIYAPITSKPVASPIRVYGWLDAGYTYASSGHGPLSVEPRPNHFGREFTVNQIALTIDKPIDPKELSWGFVIRPYGGSDATLYNPIRGAVITNPDPRFGFDFRDLYLQAHLPILTEGGVDLIVGQHYPLIGYQSAMAPYRTFYSSDYQWFYGEAGAFTGVISTVHLNKQLDVVNAITFGYLTLFTNVSVAPIYMGRLDYWVQEDKKTMISLGVVTGPVSPHSGANTTLSGVTVTHNWSKYFTQVVQFNAGYSQQGMFVPGIERYYSLYNLFLCHVNPKLDLNFRAEWYDDVDGRSYPGGTGFRNHYEEITVGLDVHPTQWLQIRPELRGDFANNTAAFGPVAGPFHRSQFTPAIECLIKF